MNETADDVAVTDDAPRLMPPLGQIAESLDDAEQQLGSKNFGISSQQQNTYVDCAKQGDFWNML